MLVKVTMKDGTLYKGVKCGSESGFLYIVNPLLLTEVTAEMQLDDCMDIGDFMKSDDGEEVNGIRLLMVPIANIKSMTSVQD